MSCSSSSSSSHQWKHDVFVSFRGIDLRNNFISHLFHGLDQAGIDYFSDDNREDTGEEIQGKIFRAIHCSRFALVVFSPNYADSKWCLYELVEILECRRQLKNHGHMVVPIFHGVKPADVSNLTSGSEFARGFERLCMNKRDDAQIRIWRDALTEAKHLSGFDLKHHVNGNESKLTEIVVKYLIEKIRPTRSLYFVKNTIGADHLAEDMISLLGICPLSRRTRKSFLVGQKEEVRMIGICGKEGIGKTTVAGVTCNNILGDFDCFVFLDKIGEANRSDLLGLQKKLLQNLMKVKGLKTYDDIHTNINEIKSIMYRKKMLLVLDDVTKKEQMDYFGAGERESFHPGSIIMVTTRDRTLLKVLKVDDEYIVKGLSPDEALQLFRRHAFKREEPKGYEELCKNLTHYAGGHPLALKRLGSYLSNKSKDHWHEILNKLVRSPHLDCIDGDNSSLSPPLQSVGPYGGQGGVSYDDGTYTGVRQISVLVKSVIESITIDYDQDGCLMRSLKHGGHLDGETYTVKLDYPNEYLTSISGHIRDDQTPIVIQSLKFHTNRKTYGPFGSEQGESFHFPQVDGAKIVGFHGKCGKHLDSIGAHFGPISHAYPFEVVGPFGGSHGMDIWDDGKYTDVRKIVVGFDSVVKSISTLYDKYGHPVGPLSHGTNEGGKTYEIKLDYPHEYLTSASGHTENASGVVILKSLTIHTNVKSYGPFGTAEGRYFSFPYTGGKIVGFHGSCDGPRLESIGAFYEPIPHTYPVKVFGPFGGAGGDSWDDGQYANIKRILVRYESSINSIDFDYFNMDGSIRSARHGSKLQGRIYEVILDYPDEFITSVAGFFTATMNSLTFRTNKRIWGPIGREDGQYFSLPSEAGKIIGFFGRSGDSLVSIGAQIELHSNMLYPFKSVGLFQSSSGSSWELYPFERLDLFRSSSVYCWDNGNEHTNVRKIIVEFETSKWPFIRSIRFQYEEENKKLWQLEAHDGVDGNTLNIGRNVKIHTIEIHDPDEYLTSISGVRLGGIRSLTFQTNKRMIGPIGKEWGKHFSSPATGGKIVGFYGTSGEQLEAIGAYFEPISCLYPIKSIGPFGGLGGCVWDDGTFSGVREIEVMYDFVIRGIMFVYDKSGEQVCSVMHGSRTGQFKSKVKLDYPREYLISISGYKREDGDNVNNAIVESLTFHSNRGRHGPFGKDTGKHFWYPSTGSKIIGFYGRCGEALNSIGVYAEPLPHLYPFKTIGPFGGTGGTPWDDGVHSDVRGFEINAHLVIHSIRILYDDNGSFVICSHHGREEHQSSRHQVMLDYPKERLVSISGYRKGNENSPDTTICDLKIHTTKTTYGPFAWKSWLKDEGDFHIPSALGGGRIVGFFGKAGSHLNSIGARLEPY
ncbi:jacalin-related lectin 4 isoform X2 [Eucalyptus grandis]|uniref:jacalin-related lectin 4 isoform X2 n=1 Tax=Eucalyptus grandis TaxID=71139 RepID=UPI0008A0F693|nr:jacalin-related lectin 4 isoform X2 [Eucalyptus grandis]